MSQKGISGCLFFWSVKTQSVAKQIKTLLWSGLQVAAHGRNWIIKFNDKVFPCASETSNTSQVKVL